MISGLAFASSIHFSRAQTSIPANSIIASDTVWTPANSPYTSTGGKVLVENGVTLTIEPGVTVLDASLLINGTLVAKGTENKEINFEGTLISFTQYSSPWNTQTGTGCIIEYANIVTQNYALSPAGISILGSSPRISNNNLNCGLGVSGGSPVILNNQFTSFSHTDNYGRAQLAEGGIALNGGNNVTITNNDLSQADFSIEGPCSLTAENNVLPGIGFDYGILNVNAVIDNNTLTAGIFVPQGSNNLQLSFMYNNFDYNTSKYGTIQWYSTENLNAPYDWWGTSDQQAINQTITDFKDNFNSGTVNFTPYLTAPNPQAMPNGTVGSSGTMPSTSTALTPAPSSSASLAQNPTATFQQPTAQSTFAKGLNWEEIAIIGLTVTVIALIVVALFYRSKSGMQTKRP